MARIVALVATALIFGALDAVWLNTMYTRLYLPHIGELMGDLRWVPALAFYALYIVGIQIFAVAPALAAGRAIVALRFGALFGLFCYATYDLTNQATLRVWSTTVTLADMAWGTFATGTAAAAASAIALHLTRRTQG